MTRFAPMRHACLAAAALLCTAALAATPRRPAAESPWGIAEAARAQLASIPPAQRTAADYRTVMDAYRLIYHSSPADLHAPESIFRVGSLLEEEGVVLRDPHSMQAALGQFEFLRKQYPTSSLRIAALLEEARIAAAGLHDNKLATARYAAFTGTFPRSAHSTEAHDALIALHAGTAPVIPDGPLASSTAAAAPVVRNTAPASEPDTSIAIAHRNTATLAAAGNGVPGSTVAPAERAEASLLANERRATPADSAAAQQQTLQPASTQPPPATAGHAVIDAVAHTPARTHAGMATVTGIRHWSTPTYTRVAIDLGDEVEYQAARVPRPDRIFFDLHNTRLAQDLAGKTYDITGDGFLRRIRIAQYDANSTRVVLDVNAVTEYSAFLLPNPYRLIIDIHGAAASPPTQADQSREAAPAPAAIPSASGREPAPSRTAAVPSSVPNRTTSTRDVTALAQQPGRVDATPTPTTRPIAVVADNAPDADAEKPATAKRIKRANRDTAPASLTNAPSDVSVRRTAAPTSDGERSLMRALGLKIGRIVIDPGHGGHDSGTIGAGGIMEKDVVLDVALRLGKLLHDHLGAEIVYTRSDDTFIPLETRTAIANQAQADLFLSIHANSSPDDTARGVETYYLNFTSQPDALDVAARENAVSDQSVHELASMVKKITLKDKIEESREFAQDVEASLYDGLHGGNAGLKNRGVKKAPFVVLIGANMPSILTEISFVTNPDDAAQLRTGAYRERVAESIYRGVARYTQGLGGMRVATAARPAKPTTDPTTTP